MSEIGSVEENDDLEHQSSSFSQKMKNKISKVKQSIQKITGTFQLFLKNIKIMP